MLVKLSTVPFEKGNPFLNQVKEEEALALSQVFMQVRFSESPSFTVPLPLDSSNFKSRGKIGADKFLAFKGCE